MRKFIILFFLFASFVFCEERLENIFFERDIVNLGNPFIAYAIDNGNSKASLYLINGKGKVVASIAGFRYPLMINKYVWVFVLGIDSTLVKDNYKLKFKIDDEETLRDIHIKRIGFYEEKINITKNMLKVKTTNNPEQTRQTNKLSKILYTFDDSMKPNEKKFIEPVQDIFYTSAFGDRRLFKYPDNSKYSKVHYGVDYRAPTGTKVFAPADGKVVFAGFRILTGNSLVLEVYPGIYILFYHLSKIKVKVGDNFNQGDVLALSGATGFATGPHLHFEVRVNGIAVNPLFFVKNNILDKKRILKMLSIKQTKKGLF